MPTFRVALYDIDPQAIFKHLDRGAKHVLGTCGS